MTFRNHAEEIADAMAQDHRETHARVSINVNRPPHDPMFYDRITYRDEDRRRAGQNVAQRREQIADEYDDPYQIDPGVRMVGFLVLAAFAIMIAVGGYFIAKKIFAQHVAAMLGCPTPRC